MTVTTREKMELIDSVDKEVPFTPQAQELVNSILAYNSIVSKLLHSSFRTWTKEELEEIKKSMIATRILINRICEH